ncbi:MAG: DNA polymerase III subunit delta [Treponema sp.]|nr:DNA polymerase III subunit delta [Treponema sp.]
MTKKASKKEETPAWLFLGPEIGEKQLAIDQIKAKLPENTALEETVYYAGETTVPVMLASMRNPSLFADWRIFFIKSAEGIKKKEDITLLSSYISSPAENTFLVLISEETSVAKGLENLFPPANKRVFWELLDERKIEWLVSFFKGKGFKISDEGIETILELVENNTAALRQECWRLCLFLEGSKLDGSKEISAEDAEKWLSHTRSESAFTLFTRIAAGDLSRSLESMRMLLAAKEAPPAIFAGLASCFRKLQAYLALKGARVNDEWEYRKIGVSSPGAKRDYAAAARRYDSAGAESCLALCAEYDLLLRSSLSFPVEILMDSYLYKIHSLGR